MRRTIIIALVFLALIALAVYVLFFSRQEGELTVDSDATFGIADGYGSGSEALEEQPLGQMEGQAGEEVAPKLTRITSEPVAYGVAVLPVTTFVDAGTNASGTPLTATKEDVEVRYIERASGNVYAYRADARTLARISNRTLPGVYEASWLSDGTFVYARFVSETDDVVETYALPVGESEGGYFLEPGLSEVAVRGTSTVVTLLPSTSGSIATIATPEGTGVRTLFSSALSSLRLLFSGTNIVAYTKASSQTTGYAFLVNSTSGAFERIIGPARGLTALPSPKGTYVFYTSLSGNTLRASMLTMNTRAVTSIPIGTMAEKCVWTTDETALYCAVPRAFTGTIDDWYMGTLSFSDRIWRVDLAGRVAVLVFDPVSVANTSIDAVSLTLDEAGDHLVFTNKTDGSLWMYDL